MGKDNSFVKNSWEWIDDDHGIVARYYFDTEGNLLQNTTTPDQCVVNEKGEWVENNLVKLKITDLKSVTGWKKEMAMRKSRCY